MDLDVAQIEGMLPIIIEWGMRILSALAIMIAGWVIGNKVEGFFGKFKKLDSTLKTFLGAFAKYTIMVLAFITVLGQFGVQTASLLALLGAAGLAIGLALQGTLSNVAAGVMMLILRPFSVGDVIEFQGHKGTVKALGLFGCELATLDNIYMFAPNSTIWSSDIYNYTRNTQRRLDVTIGISYGDDINKAFKIIEKAIGGDDRLINTGDKAPQIMVSNLGASSVDVTARVWCKTLDVLDVKWDLTKSMKEALDKGGINIPFPTRTIHHVNPQPVETQKKTTKK